MAAGATNSLCDTSTVTSVCSCRGCLRRQRERERGRQGEATANVDDLQAAQLLLDEQAAGTQLDQLDTPLAVDHLLVRQHRLAIHTSIDQHKRSNNKTSSDTYGAVGDAEEHDREPVRLALHDQQHKPVAAHNRISESTPGGRSSRLSLTSCTAGLE
jgi:hypothetical protein